MLTQLLDSSYGKANVKFLKVKKNPTDSNIQDVLQANCQVLLKGAFNESYTHADNSAIVPTDTVKNTILVEAKTSNVWPIERFAAHLAKHFTTKYLHISEVDIRIEQSRWQKFLLLNGEEHPHSFRYDGPETRNTHLCYCREGGDLSVVSSIKDLTVLKLTGSMFYGFNKCDYTTLKPTTDRILSTSVLAEWKFDSSALASFDAVFSAADAGLFDDAYDKARSTTLDLFATENLPSVQATMYNMSHKILELVPQIATVLYELPNIHYFLFNLEWKGIDDNTDLFYPLSDPNGLIKCTVGRKP